MKHLILFFSLTLTLASLSAPVRRLLGAAENGEYDIVPDPLPQGICFYMENVPAGYTSAAQGLVTCDTDWMVDFGDGIISNMPYTISSATLPAHTWVEGGNYIVRIYCPDIKDLKAIGCNTRGYPILATGRNVENPYVVGLTISGTAGIRLADSKTSISSRLFHNKTPNIRFIIIDDPQCSVIGSYFCSANKLTYMPIAMNDFTYLGTGALYLSNVVERVTYHNRFTSPITGVFGPGIKEIYAYQDDAMKFTSVPDSYNSFPDLKLIYAPNSTNKCTQLKNFTNSTTICCKAFSQGSNASVNLLNPVNDLTLKYAEGATYQAYDICNQPNLHKVDVSLCDRFRAVRGGSISGCTNIVEATVPFMTVYYSGTTGYAWLIDEDVNRKCTLDFGSGKRHDGTKRIIMKKQGQSGAVTTAFKRWNGCQAIEEVEICEGCEELRSGYTDKYYYYQDELSKMTTMKSLKFHDTIPPAVADDYQFPTTGKIYVPRGSLSAYLQADGFCDKADMLEEWDPED